MTENTNPFLTAYHTPFETIPFHLIKTEHFEPAIEEGMKVHNQEVDAPVSQGGCGHRIRYSKER